MTKLLTIIALLAFAVPAAFAAPPPGKGKPESVSGTPSAQSSTPGPAQLCKEQLRTMGAVNFQSTYAPNGNGRSAMGKCVSQQTQTVQQATENAAKKCKAERQSMGLQGFVDRYGKNANGRNAFGKCVSGYASAKVEAQQEETLDAAKACKAERQSMGAQAFADKHGTGSKRNAFGKCVSKAKNS